MPHLVALYTRELDALTDMGSLCRCLADAMLAVRDEAGAQVFPTGGTRVLAYPAAHSAVADGTRDYLFIYLNLRMGRGRQTRQRQCARDDQTCKLHGASRSIAAGPLPDQLRRSLKSS